MIFTQEHQELRRTVRAFVDPAMRGDARLLAWVLMPDHVHWLLQAGQST